MPLGKLRATPAPPPAPIQVAGPSRICPLPTTSEPQKWDAAGHEVETSAMEIDDSTVSCSHGPGTAELLSLSQSMTISHALNSTRQRHLTSLLPRVFSHPKSRGRSRPYSGVEYHPSTTFHSVNTEATKGKGKQKAAVQEAPQATLVDGPPAHELSCVGWCGMQVGPVEYEGVSIWIGKFVRDRPGDSSESDAQKRDRERKDRERKDRERQVQAQAAARKRQEQQQQQQKQQANLVKPADIPLTLIQKVNQAASQHPWLATLIHKAAKHEATKDELAQLGKVVNTLQAQLAAAAAVPAAPAKPVPTASTSVAQSAASTPGSEAASTTFPAPATGTPVATGKAVTPAAGIASISNSPSVATVTNTKSSQAQAAHPGQKLSGPGESRPVSAIAATPSTQKSTNAASPVTASQDKAQVPARPVGAPGPAVVPQVSVAQQPFRAQYHPGPTYLPPRPPAPALAPELPSLPFILLSFRDNIADKFLLPLGTQSFISRVPWDAQPRQEELPTKKRNTVKSFSTLQQEEEEDAMEVDEDLWEQQPAPGTILISLMVPSKGWKQPKWPARPKPATLQQQQVQRPVGSVNAPALGPPPPMAMRPACGSSAGSATLSGQGTVPKVNMPTHLEHAPTTVAVAPASDAAASAPSATAPTQAPKAESPPSGPTAFATSNAASLTRSNSVEASSAPASSGDAQGKPPGPASAQPVAEGQSSAAAAAAAAAATAGSAAPTSVAVKEAPLPSSPSAASRVQSGTALPQGPSTPLSLATSGATSLASAGKSSPSLAPAVYPPLIRLATTSLIPDKGPVRPVTIRLTGVTEAAWRVMQETIRVVEHDEIGDLAIDNPPAKPPAKVVPAQENAAADTSSPAAEKLTRAAEDERRKEAEKQRTKLQEAYEAEEAARLDKIARRHELKAVEFRKLMERVPERVFLKHRLDQTMPEVIEAEMDRFAPRLYNIYPKSRFGLPPPAYRSTMDDTAQLELDLEEPSAAPAPANPRKRKAEPAVAFEVPMSFEEIDQAVEEQARKAAMKGQGGGTRRRKSEVGQDGKRTLPKRSAPGTICEGCGSSNQRVWRKGPGGKATLCNSCGDKHNAGTLGPLVAPGAAKRPNPSITAPGTAPTAGATPTGPTLAHTSGSAPGNPAAPTIPSNNNNTDSPSMPLIGTSQAQLSTVPSNAARTPHVQPTQANHIATSNLNPALSSGTLTASVVPPRVPVASSAPPMEKDPAAPVQITPSVHRPSQVTPVPAAPAAAPVGLIQSKADAPPTDTAQDIASTSAPTEDR